MAQPDEHESESESGASAGYFTHARLDLLERIPPDATSILELGCGAGHLGRAVKDRQNARVVGLEFDEGAAAAASEVLDEVHRVDLNVFKFPWPEGTFDCAVAGDILEHLIDPWAMLDKVKKALSPNGTLVVSIPNASFPQVLEQLGNGRLDYEDAGILDRTHLRFFTRSTFTEALERAGFYVVRADPVVHPLYYQIPEHARNGGETVSFGTVSVQMRDFNHVIDVMAYQWLFVANA